MFSGGLGIKLGASMIGGRTCVSVEIDSVTHRNAVLKAKALAQDAKIALDRELNLMDEEEERKEVESGDGLAFRHRQFNEQGECIEGGNSA